MSKFIYGIKLTADILIWAMWLTVIILSTIMRDWVTVAISAAFVLTFLYFVWYDASKLDSMRSKYLIMVEEGTYYDGARFTCRAKAKEYRSLRAVSKAVAKLINEEQITTAPLIEMWFNDDGTDEYDY